MEAVGQLGLHVERGRVLEERLVPLAGLLVGGPRRVGDGVPVHGVPAGDHLAVGEHAGAAGRLGAQRPVGRRPVVAVEGDAQDHLGGRRGRAVLLGGGEVAEHGRGERRVGLGCRGVVERVFHDEEGVDGGREGGDVVEAAGVRSRAGVGVHGHLVVRVGPVDGGGDRGHQPGQADLVGRAVALEVEVHPVHVLGLDGREQGGRESGGRRRARRQCVERALVEIVHGEHHPVTGGVRPGDQGGEIGGLVAVPARPRLVERAVGVHPDREVGEGGEAGQVIARGLAEGPVGGEPEDLVAAQRGGARQRGWCGGGRRGGGRQVDGRGRDRLHAATHRVHLGRDDPHARRCGHRLGCSP